MTVDEEYDGKWCAGLVECQICTYQWAAAWPEVAEKLECPHCGILSEPIIIEQPK